MLQSMGLQRVRDDLAIEQQQQLQVRQPGHKGRLGVIWMAELPCAV